MKEETSKKMQNVMRAIRIEKVVLNCGATGEKLDKSLTLLNLVTNKKPIKTKSTKRIPAFGVKPGLEIGCKVTLRGKSAEEILMRLFEAVDNKIKKKQIAENQFAFGIREYIEVPGMEYRRDIGTLGFEVCVVFKRAGKKVGLKKIKRGKISKVQKISKEEIADYIRTKFHVEIV